MPFSPLAVSWRRAKGGRVSSAFDSPYQVVSPAVPSGHTVVTLYGVHG